MVKQKDFKMTGRLKNSLRQNESLLKLASIVFRYIHGNSFRIKRKNNSICYKGAFLKNTKIRIWGKNNTVLFEPGSKIYNTDIKIFGDNCLLYIARNCTIRKAGFWFEDKGCEIKIGENTLVVHADFSVMEGKSISVGKNSMLAYDIDIRTGDAHSIIDTFTQQRINPSKDITIGEHVWIGAHSILLQGTTIEKDTIIGAGSLVNKKFEKGNIIIAGNPAKIIKENIRWDKKRI
jgi:acetyltransferase-like isoleucine patch superfamily enzyme